MYQVALACLAYESTKQHFPRSSNFFAASFQVILLPFLEQQSLYDRFDLDLPPTNPTNLDCLSHRPQTYFCPSDPIGARWVSATNYLGNFGKHRLDKANSGVITGVVVRAGEIADGLSYTALLSEAGVHRSAEDSFDVGRLRYVDQKITDTTELADLENLAWGAPATTFDGSLGNAWNFGGLGQTCYNHFFTPNTRSVRFAGHAPTTIATASSHHPGGVNLVAADGANRWISNAIDREIWTLLGDRDDRLAKLPW